MNLMALLSRFKSTCRSRSWSPTTCPCRLAVDVDHEERSLFVSADERTMDRDIVDQAERRERPHRSRSMRPASILEKSRMSLTTVSRARRPPIGGARYGLALLLH